MFSFLNLALSVLLIATSAHAEIPTDINKPTTAAYNKTTCFFPFQETLGDVSCYEYVRQRTVKGSRFSMFSTDRFEPLKYDLDPWLRVAEEAVEMSLEFYAPFLGRDKGLDITLFVQKQSNYSIPNRAIFTGVGQYWMPPNSSDACYLDIPTFESDYNSYWKHLGEVQYSIAFQMYFCVLARVGHREPDRIDIEKLRAPDRWWYEGSADFFGAQLFPPTGDGWDNWSTRTRWWLTLESLCNWQSASGLFLMHLADYTNWTNTQMHSWVLSQNYSNDISAEKRRIEADSLISKAWYTFATRYIDRKSEFKYTNGVPIHWFPSEWWEVSEYKLGWSGIDRQRDMNRQFALTGRFDFDVRVRPFQLVQFDAEGALFGVNVTVGQDLEVTFKAQDPLNDRVVLQWRLGMLGKWQQMRSGDSIQIHGPPTLSAGSANENNTYIFAGTSTKFYKYAVSDSPYEEGDVNNATVTFKDLNWREPRV